MTLHTFHVTFSYILMHSAYSRSDCWWSRPPQTHIQVLALLARGPTTLVRPGKELEEVDEVEVEDAGVGNSGTGEAESNPLLINHCSLRLVDGLCLCRLL